MRKYFFALGILSLICVLLPGIVMYMLGEPIYLLFILSLTERAVVRDGNQQIGLVDFEMQATKTGTGWPAIVETLPTNNIRTRLHVRGLKHSSVTFVRICCFFSHSHPLADRIMEVGRSLSFSLCSVGIVWWPFLVFTCPSICRDVGCRHLLQDQATQMPGWISTSLIVS